MASTSTSTSLGKRGGTADTADRLPECVSVVQRMAGLTRLWQVDGWRGRRYSFKRPGSGRNVAVTPTTASLALTSDEPAVAESNIKKVAFSAQQRIPHRVHLISRAERADRSSQPESSAALWYCLCNNDAPASCAFSTLGNDEKCVRPFSKARPRPPQFVLRCPPSDTRLSLVPDLFLDP